MQTLAIQYPSFGPQHPPRIDAIARAAPGDGWRIVAMEMFARDSDYEWDKVTARGALWKRHTMMAMTSADGRRFPRLRETVYQALDEIGPTVLVVNGWGHRESRHSLDWCRRTGCPPVLLSDSVRENRHRHWWKEAIKRWVIRGCKAGFAAGRPQSRYLVSLGIPPSQVFQPGTCVVDNAFWSRETARIRATTDLREKLGLPARYFLCVARFISFKNIPFLIDAYAKYVARSRGRPISLVLCGSGQEEAHIRERVAANRLSTVHFLGFRQVDELPTFYAYADCLVLPSSSFECWGLVVNEAMASGLPVLASKEVGSAEDLVHNGVNGYTFDPTCVDELADCLTRIAESSSLRASMGAESCRIIEQHSLEVAAKSLWSAVECAMRQQ